MPTVILSVGGQEYTTTLETLQSDSESMLARLASEQWHEDADRIFIDRDGSLFRYILGYLRNGPNAVLPEEGRLLRELRLEADYFQLDGLLAMINELNPISSSWRPYVGEMVRWQAHVDKDCTEFRQLWGCLVAEYGYVKGVAQSIFNSSEINATRGSTYCVECGKDVDGMSSLSGYNFPDRLVWSKYLKDSCELVPLVKKTLGYVLSVQRTCSRVEWRIPLSNLLDMNRLNPDLERRRIEEADAYMRDPDRVRREARDLGQEMIVQIHVPIKLIESVDIEQFVRNP